MATSYKTPGVYVEEITTLPASIAQVETAIPAFIGYTEKAEKLNGDPITEPKRISSLLEYETFFGGPQKERTITVTVSGSGDERTVKANEPTTKSIFLMYYSMKMYFKNGGGPCYIISVGDYSADSIYKDKLGDGLLNLEKEDEPTLILFPDATNLGSIGDFNGVYADALTQCNKLKDRFVIFDTYTIGDGAVDQFRTLSSGYLKYGAAYYPWLKTNLNYVFDESNVDVSGIVTYTLTDDIIDAQAASENNEIKLGSQQVSSLKALEIIDQSLSKSEFEEAVKEVQMTDARFTALVEASKEPSSSPTDLASIKDDDTKLYNRIKAELNELTVTLPPSSTIAGVYARVDSDRGVWKAPANVTVTGVIEPAVKITHEFQTGMNIHTSGKSINAIRSFTGRGILVWGARTLAGNDNEWKYVPVRRLFNMVEESVKKATEFVVFEPNDANTWVRVKAMIENYLTGLWRAGALTGAKPNQAFFVNVGLGTTMTAQDILEGRMNIEIGMAAVRPAEFIILKFSHKLQEA